METVHTLLFVLQVLVAVALIGLILVQHGKGADAGAAFGSGSSSTVFGSQGSGNFMTKVTTILVVIFLGNSLFLAYLASNVNSDAPKSLLDQPGVALEQKAVEKKDVPAMDKKQSKSQEADVPSLPTK